MQEELPKERFLLYEPDFVKETKRRHACNDHHRWDGRHLS
jgi:hypothetical protein